MAAAGVLSQSQLTAASQVMQARLDEVEALLAPSGHRHALTGLLQALTSSSAGQTLHWTEGWPSSSPHC